MWSTAKINQKRNNTKQSNQVINRRTNQLKKPSCNNPNYHPTIRPAGPANLTSMQQPTLSSNQPLTQSINLMPIQQHNHPINHSTNHSTINSTVEPIQYLQYYIQLSIYIYMVPADQSCGMKIFAGFFPKAEHHTEKKSPSRHGKI